MSDQPTRRPRVIIIGSGFGGLFAAQALADEPVEVTVIAKTSHHLFQPLLYQVATGILSPGEVAPATREILAAHQNTEVVLGTVRSIDVGSRTVSVSILGLQYDYDYDYLIVAAGSVTSFFGNDHFAHDAPGMKNIDDALELRGRIYGAFELAEISAARGEDEDAARLMTFVVVGAGPTGVEMAGQLVELSKRTLEREFRHIAPQDARIVLMDGGDCVLSSFHPSLQAKAQAELEEMGVEVRLGAMVNEVDELGLDYRGPDGENHRIEAVTKVWAAGVTASPLAALLAEQVGLEVDRGGRLPVNDDLTLAGHPEVFAVGDMVAHDEVPGVAQGAIQSARHAAAQIARAVEGKPESRPFTYFDKGNMATIARFRAIAEVGSVRVTGFTAWTMWLVVHLFYIIGFKSQVTTLLHWAVTFVGRDRAQRTITEQQVFGRLAMEQDDRRLPEAMGRIMRPMGAARRPVADETVDEPADQG
ncbi:MAG TPA: NAD(P)/FAD-dependent oxidoreductase [Ornithinimicrobium sp.]|uniref:NAD(P)/FAD-dependent oxidoreductase n=1 Tax=Ornithinimicrobium sp. TaxID=1977084 RepID=UPI002B494406|nr:NAD(P)/FAD-dependent oxidoreductase [Ornithinimicrobium sp.]HKJ13158.1 NAD(P)/FAD-dependent oxidoreductase [Ornithinimicrobium sp.]